MRTDENRRDIDDRSVVVARSASMRALVALARRIATVDSTVFITGESGVGKERIARLVHEASARASGPFVAVDCGAISASLLESELFGHARGAFTGAEIDRVGLFEAASGGTLFLDEVGEIPALMQVKLLRALQERQVRRVGENMARSIDVRVIAATNRHVARDLERGSLRKDLYYRLNVVELHVPSLRERRDDVLPLARSFLAKAALRMRRGVVVLSPASEAQLLRHDWPGNVRELENAIERAAALAEGGSVEVKDLPEVARGTASPRATGSDAVRPLADIEREYILSALATNHGNQTRTARQLRIGAVTLYRKLKSYGALKGSPRSARAKMTAAP